MCELRGGGDASVVQGDEVVVGLGVERSEMDGRVAVAAAAHDVPLAGGRGGVAVREVDGAAVPSFDCTGRAAVESRPCSDM